MSFIQYLWHPESNLFSSGLTHWPLGYVAVNYVISKHILMNGILSISYGIALQWKVLHSFHWSLAKIAKTGGHFLTHWGRVTHICVGNLTIIGPDNGLSPTQRQAIIWTNAGILLIGPWGTNFSEILIGIHTFSFKKIHLKMSSAKWRPFCLSLNVLISFPGITWHQWWHRPCWLT